MSNTFTNSSTFTITHARYITSKIAADLRQMKLFYGEPDDDDIESYAEEAALLLRDGYLERIDYGFMVNDAYLGKQWRLLLRYHVKSGVLNDDHSGRVPPGVDISGATFWSFLSYSSKFYTLTPVQQNEIKETLPVSRSSGSEAGYVAGSWTSERSYSKSNEGVSRSVFKAQ